MLYYIEYGFLPETFLVVQGNKTSFFNRRDAWLLCIPIIYHVTFVLLGHNTVKYSVECGLWCLLDFQPTNKKQTSNERPHEVPSSEQMHPYVAKVCTVGYLDQTKWLCGSLSYYTI